MERYFVYLYSKLCCTVTKLAIEVEHLIFMFVSRHKKKWVVPIWNFELQAPADFPYVCKVL